MTDSDERSVSILRRQFLAGVGATSAGAAAIGSAATDDPTLALGSTEPMPINSRFNIDDYRIGPLSERPAAADAKGTVYEVTDNNASNGTLRTFSDGSQWVTLNVEADVIDTEQLSNEILYAASYSGAKGVDRIQAALDDLGSAHGTVVVDGAVDDLSGVSAAEFTSGWRFNKSLQIPDNTYLKLEGVYCFLEGGSDDNMMRNAAADSGDSTRNSNIHVEGPVRLDGNGINQTNLASSGQRYLNHGIHFYKADNCTFRNLALGPMSAFAWQMEDVTELRGANLHFHQTHSPNGDGAHVNGPGENIVVKGLTGAVQDDLTNADAIASSNYTDGFSRGGGGNLTNVTFAHGRAESGGKAGFRVMANTGARLKNVTCEDLHITGGSDHVIAVGDANATYTDNSLMQDITFKNISGDSSGEFVRTNCEGTTLHLKDLRGGASSGGNSPAFYLQDDWERITIENPDITVDGDQPFIYSSAGGPGALHVHGGVAESTVTSTRPAIEVAKSTEISSVWHIADSVFDGFDTGFQIATNATNPGGIRPSFDSVIFQNTTTDWTLNGHLIEVDGTLGGGTVGGVDLSTINGAADGEHAMSDGTATGFPKFAEARWDATNALWVRADGQATV